MHTFMKTGVAIAFAAATLGACTPATESEDGLNVMMQSETWEDALNAGDVDTLVSLYTDNARVLPPNAELAAGAEAVRAEFGAMVDAGLAGDLTSIETRQAGDIGYNVGIYTLVGPDGGSVDRGKFIEIWRRGADGQWRISNDIWNSDLPAARPAGEEALPGATTTLTIVHEVDDPERWLAAWRGAEGRRALFKAHGAEHVHVFRDSDDPNLTGLVVSLSDPDAFESFLASDTVVAAATEDTVRLDTLKVFREVAAE